ncbi:MAG: cupin domain-containing protein [Euryarchaeota archaeon]|nr:cupin domain-containing protein [Euryarchaeota archaeon]
MKEKITLEKIREKLKGSWEPVDIGEIDEYKLKAYIANGEYPNMHIHDKDKLFFVFEGNLEVIFEDHSVNLKKGEGCIVKAGEKHKSKSVDRSIILMVEHKDLVQANVE